MDIIIIRHATKTPILPDQESPISPKGELETELLKKKMEHAGIQPQIYLTSKLKRARQTAERLAPDQNAIVLIDVLTLDEQKEHLEPSQVFSAMYKEALNKGIDLDRLDMVAIVGHEPQLSELLTFLISKPGIAKSAGIQISVDSFSALHQGAGKLVRKLG